MSTERAEAASSETSQGDSLADYPSEPSVSSSEESAVLSKLPCPWLVDEPFLFRTISDFKIVASYNWMDKKHATISVPGCPPLFKPPPPDTMIQPGIKDSFKDQNAARFPSYPLGPLFRALHIMSPDPVMDSVELITCEDVLHSLLMFVCDCASTLKFDVEVVGTTAIFTKIEDPNAINTSNTQVYGPTFLEGTTVWDPDMENSICHFRVAQFRTGGINCLLRYKCNGYVNDRTIQTSPRKKNRGCFPTGSMKRISGGLAVFKANKPASTPLPSDRLEVKLAGQKIDHELTTEIQTAESADNMSRICPRLWMTQTTLCTTVQHQNGRFSSSTNRDVTKDIADWERDNKMSIVKLGHVIRDIIEVAKNSPGSRLWVKQGKNSTLLLLKPNDTMGKTALPSELKRIFFPALGDDGAGDVSISEARTAES